MSTTIMVVDDSPFASKQIKDIVEDNGYEVIGYAKNGEEGIAMYDTGYCYSGHHNAGAQWLGNSRNTEKAGS